MSRLTHLDDAGAARMVDVLGKPVVPREAVAAGAVRMQSATLDLIESDRIAKGNVLATARVAGIQAAKRTGDLIPLCHPLPITACEVGFEIPASRDRVEITATVKVNARTGVEMEALTAVTIAGLTIYDMLKGIDREIVLGETRLLEKSGGKSGPFKNDE